MLRRLRCLGRDRTRHQVTEITSLGPGADDPRAGEGASIPSLAEAWGEAGCRHPVWWRPWGRQIPLKSSKAMKCEQKKAEARRTRYNAEHERAAERDRCRVDARKDDEDGAIRVTRHRARSSVKKQFHAAMPSLAAPAQDSGAAHRRRIC